MRARAAKSGHGHPSGLLAMVPLSAIQDGVNESRRTPGDVSALADDISGSGLLEPVGVRPLAGGKYEVIYGHRRIAACRALAKSGRPYPDPVPCVVLDVSDRDRIAVQIRENAHRLGYSPLEEAEMIDSLVSSGHSTAEIASWFGRSPAWVSQRLGLMRLPQQIRDAIPEEITVYDAYLLSQLPEHEALAKFRRMRGVVCGYPAAEQSTVDAGQRNRVRFSRKEAVEAVRQASREAAASKTASRALSLVEMLLEGQMAPEEFAEKLVALIDKLERQAAK